MYNIKEWYHTSVLQIRRLRFTKCKCVPKGAHYVSETNRGKDIADDERTDFNINTTQDFKVIVTIHGIGTMAGEEVVQVSLWIME